MPSEIRNEIQKLRRGLTGIGSIVFRDEETFIYESGEDPHEFYRREIAPFKGQLEIWYSENQSMGLDFKLVFLTAWIVVFSNSRLPQIMLRDLPSHPVFNPGKLIGERDEGGAGSQ